MVKRYGIFHVLTESSGIRDYKTGKLLTFVEVVDRLNSLETEIKELKEVKGGRYFYDDD